MKGLREGFESLPRVRIHTRTTSSSGAPREEELPAIALADALAASPASRLILRSRDGFSLALPREELGSAWLVQTGEAQWMLVLSGDSTRKRRIKDIQEIDIQ